jgi:hypothetical protein
MIMSRKLAIFLFMIAFVGPGLAGAVTQEDFQAKTTRNIIDLCTAPPGDPLHQAAVNFCHGFLVGAFHYYAAANAGPEGDRLVCLPDPPPSRNEAIAMFVEWAKAHPQYMADRAVETEFRFLMEKWPCKE